MVDERAEICARGVYKNNIYLMCASVVEEPILKWSMSTLMKPQYDIFNDSEL